MTYLVSQLDSSPGVYDTLEQEEIIMRHYNYTCSELTAWAQGHLSRGLIINGPKGGGKTSLLAMTLQHLNADFYVVNGTITAPVLWRMLYTYARKPDQILVIDDTDVVFNDVEMSDMLKAALDGKGKEIHYGKAGSAFLRAHNIPSQFSCRGRIAFISNMNMDRTTMTKKQAATLSPIRDRCEYVKIGLTPAWNAVAMRVFYKHNLIHSLNVSTLTQDQKDELMDFVCEHAAMDDRWTFRTIIKGIQRMNLGSNWRDALLFSL